jgi:hypothetical protein
MLGWKRTVAILTKPTLEIKDEILSLKCVFLNTGNCLDLLTFQMSETGKKSPGVFLPGLCGESS